VKQGKELLAILKPADVIITPKLDRVFRSALNALGVLERLKQQDVSLHRSISAGTSPATASRSWCSPS
jgi:DNA invertase Pin-like site-specific DNA recombinase